MKTIITSLAALLLFSVSTFANANTDMVASGTSNESSAKATVSVAAYSQLAAENFTLQLKLDELQTETDNLNSMLDYAKMMNTTMINLNETILEEKEADTAAQLSYASMMSNTLVHLNTEVLQTHYILYQ